MQKVIIKKEEIINVALRLMFQHGYKGLTMRMLAEEAGYDVGNLYNYISSKQDILVDNLLFISNEFVTRVQFIHSAELSFESKLRAIVQLYVSLADSYPYHASLLINEWRHLDEEASTRFLKERHYVEQTICDILVSSPNIGILSPTKQQWTLQYVLSSLRWIFPLFVEEDRPNPLELEEFIVSKVCGGL